VFVLTVSRQEWRLGCWRDVADMKASSAMTGLEL
jgi:hypothetical protein